MNTIAMTHLPQHSLKGTGRKALAGWLVAVILLGLLFSTVDFSDVCAAFLAARTGPLLAGAALLFAAYLLRAWRWALAGSFSFGEALRSLSAGMLLNNLLPGRGGDILIPSIQRRLDRTRTGSAFASFTLLRMADTVALGVSVVLLAVLSLTPAGSVIIGLFYAGACICVALGVLFGAGLLERRRLGQILGSLHRIFPGHLTTPRLRFLQTVLEGFDLVAAPARLLLLSLLTLAVWALEIAVLHFLSRAFSLDLSASDLVLLVAVINLATILPVSPGGIGLEEWSGAWILLQIGVEFPTAVAVVAAQHIIQYVVVFILGAPASVRLRMAGILSFSGEDALLIQLPQDAHYESVIAPEERLAPALQTLLDEESLAKSPAPPALSVVIPAFNEEQRLPPTLSSVITYLRAAGDSFEILVVDDGSRDGTAGVVRRVSADSPEVRLVSHDKNMGKGAAVRTGAAESRGSLVLLYDADGATPIEELPRLKAAIGAGSHIGIGSRALFSADTTVKTNWYRKLLGRVFNAIVNMTILPGIGDTQCGFKLFTRAAARYLFPRQTADGFSFDVELLFLAKQAGCRISEVPVNWSNIPGSKVHLLSDSLRMLMDVFKFRARFASGRYRH